jgi:DNA polymerase-3 subunit delta
MKIQGRDVERALRAPDRAVTLLYGPDAGLVGERATRLGRSVVDDLEDPFRVSELGGEQLALEPQRLALEAQSLCLLGGRRLVRVRRMGDPALRALELLVAHETIEALVVLEAEDLGAASSLRKLAERSPAVAVIACYREEGRDLAQSIRGLLGEAGLAPEPDALTYLAGHLGADREVTRREIEKLALCVGPGQERVTLDDAAAVVGDSAALAMDGVTFGWLAGDRARLERNLARLLGEGTPPVAILRASLSMVVRLLRLQAEVERGSTPQAAVDGARPPVFFRMKGQYAAALGAWPAARLAGALALLQETEIRCKSVGAQGALLCRHALGKLADRVAQTPRRRERQPPTA